MVFSLFPVAVDLEDNQDVYDRYFELIADRIQKNTDVDL